MQVHWFVPGRQVCRHLGVQPLSHAQPAPLPECSETPGSNFSRRRGRSLANAFLFGSAHSYFKSGVELSLGRYRVSSLAFAPIAEKQVQCNALGFLNLNSCRAPKPDSQQSCWRENKDSGEGGLGAKKGSRRRGGRGPPPGGCHLALLVPRRAGVQRRGAAPVGRGKSSCAGCSCAGRRGAGTVPAEPCGT